MDRRLPVPLFIAFGILAAGAHTYAQEEDTLPPAQPMTYNCATDYSTRVFVDGNQSDWEQEVGPTDRVQQLVAGTYRYDWTGPNDSSFMMWCRESEHALYFAVIARDNVLHGPSRGSRGDRFELYFDAPQANGRTRRLVMEAPVHPAAEDQPTRLLWREGGPEGQEVPAGRADVVSRLFGTNEGFFLEIMVPRTALGTDFGVAPIPFAAVYRDVDGDQNSEQEAGIATAPFDRSGPTEMGMLTRGLLDEHLDRVRRRNQLDESVEPTFATYENVGGDAQPEYVAMLGGHLVIIGAGLGDFDSATFPTQVVGDQRDIGLEFRDIDMDGDNEIIHRFAFEREDLATGTVVEQRIAGLYDLTGAGIRRFGHQQYAVDIDGVGELTSEPDFVRRPTMLIVRFRRPRSGGISQSDWIDVDEGVERDYQPMLLPWASEQHIIYYPAGDDWAFRAE